MLQSQPKECHTNPPWVNDDLLQEIKERKYLKKVASRSNLTQDWAAFRRKRNSVNERKRHLKRDYYQSTLNENRQNSQKLWKTLNNITPGSKQCNTLPQSILKNNIEISDKKEIAKTVNEFFISILPIFSISLYLLVVFLSAGRKNV